MTKRKYLKPLLSVLLAMIFSLSVMVSAVSAAEVSSCTSPQIGNVYSYQREGTNLVIQFGDNFTVDEDHYLNSNGAYFPFHAYMYPFMDFTKKNYMPVYAMYEVINNVWNTEYERYFTDDVILALSPDVRNGNIKSSEICCNGMAGSNYIRSTYSVDKNTVSVSNKLEYESGSTDFWKTTIKFDSKGNITSIKTRNGTYQFKYKKNVLSSVKRNGEDFMEYKLNSNGQFTRIDSYGGLPWIYCTYSYNKNGILTKTKFANHYDDSATVYHRDLTISYQTTNGGISSVSLKGKESDQDLNEGVTGEDCFKPENWTTRTHTINTVLNYQ